MSAPDLYLVGPVLPPRGSMWVVGAEENHGGSDRASDLDRAARPARRAGHQLARAGRVGDRLRVRGAAGRRGADRAAGGDGLRRRAAAADRGLPLRLRHRRGGDRLPHRGRPGGRPAAAGRGPPGAGRAAPDRDQRGGPADLGAAAGGAAAGRAQGRVPRLPPRPGVDLRRGALPAGRRPARQLLDRPGAAVALGARDLGRPDGQPGRARVHPDRRPAVAEEPAAQRERQHRRRPEPELRLHVGHAQHQHLQPRPVGRDLRRARGRSPSRRSARCATWSPPSSSTGC